LAEVRFQTDGAASGAAAEAGAWAGLGAGLGAGLEAGAGATRLVLGCFEAKGPSEEEEPGRSTDAACNVRFVDIGVSEDE
jgi:hypothetical protein